MPRAIATLAAVLFILSTCVPPLEAEEDYYLGYCFTRYRACQEYTFPDVYDPEVYCADICRQVSFRTGECIRVTNDVCPRERGHRFKCKCIDRI